MSLSSSPILKRVSLLGSTGSIGTNTLNVIRQHSDCFQVVSLSCGSSIESLLSQIQEFKPLFVSVVSEEKAADLRSKLPADFKGDVFVGIEGHRRCIEEARPDIVMSSMMGTFGLEATLAAVKQGVSILGVANKEILVMAGTFILEALKTSRTKLVPVDSEHSAIFQALMGNSHDAIHSIILTGSGGPFRTRDVSSFAAITKAEALKHPNWVMGAKITIDSATMMNKGLEYIEALRLFQVRADQMRIVVHPESVVHSLVEYVDGSVMAQLGISDMRIPIALALGYPDRLSLDLGKRLDLVSVGSLHFEEPDLKKFPCLRLAIEAEASGAEGPIILNAANEAAVEMFLNDRIRFVEIAEAVEAALAAFKDERVANLEAVVDLDSRVRSWVLLAKSSVKSPASQSRRSHISHETMGA